MTCDAILERLDEYVDGGLAEAEFQEVERHLADCAACRQQEKELRRLLALAAALPRAVAPGRDLYPGILERLEPRRVVSLASRRRPWVVPTLAAAATVLVAFGATLFRSTPDRTPDAGAAPAGRVVPAAAGLPADLAAVELEYGRAASELREALDARRGTLAPDTLEIVDRNLRTIDTALEEIRQALRQDPANADLARMLRSTHRRKVELLQQVTRLAS